MGDSWRGDRDRGRYDNYPPPPPDRYDRDPPRQPRDRDHGGFQFRGAAQTDSYRPQEQRQPDFDFRASGPSAPRFPPAAPGQYSQQATQRRERRGNDRGRGGGRGRGRGGFQRSRAAHARDLISKSTRAATPEQMEGMNDEGKARYVDQATSDEDEDAASTGGGDDEDQPFTKRTKTTTTADEASAAPKWSNPDPYTVLPPTDMSMAPKKDIVQTIRKSKIEAANKASSANAIADNVDFISFDDFNDQAMDEAKDDVSEDGEIEDSGGVDLGFDITPQFDRAPSVGAPPPPPLDVPLPNHRELRALNNDSLREQEREAPRGEVGTILPNHKRKRPREQSSSQAGAIADEWAPDGSNPTPWCRADATFSSHVGLQLHKELIDFHEFVRPLSFEYDCRNDLIDRIQRAIRSFPRGGRDIEVRSFGSFACGLYLPTADMDLVAVSPAYLRTGQKTFCQSKSNMWALSGHLRTVAKEGSMVVIHKAKVPIIKFVDKRTDLKVDISFENDSGLRAIDTFLDWKSEFPEAPQLVVVIKQLLAMRGLNEVHSGGIGGFTIICLVVSMFQLMPQEQSRSGNPQGRLGELLLNFLDLYGNKFDKHTTGIFMDPPGYFNKRTDYTPARINATGLTIIDPNRADNDISGGSKQIDKVFKCFKGALAMIQEQLGAVSRGESDDSSILGCVLGGNYSSFIEQREILRACQSQPQQSYRPPPPPPARPPPPPQARPQQSRHALPPRPAQQQGYDYPQTSAYAPQPAGYMQQLQDDHRRLPSYNYPPPAAHDNQRPQRPAENGYSGSRQPPQYQESQREKNQPAGDAEPKKKGKRARNRTGLQGNPIDLT